MDEPASNRTAAELPGRLWRTGRDLLARVTGRHQFPKTPVEPNDLPAIWRDRTLTILSDRWDWSTDLLMRLVPDSGLASHDLRLRREAMRIVAELPVEMGQRVLGNFIGRFSAAYLVQFRAATGAREMIVTLSDGNMPGTYRFSPSTPYHDVVAIPDPYFFRDNGYARADKVWRDGPDWDDRDDALIWRGTPNGIGLFSWDPAMVDLPGLMPRCRLVMYCKGSEIDAGFVFSKTHHYWHYEPFFAANGLLGAAKDRMSWVNHRYALDIDGLTNAWDNFLVRLKLGCCVLKVESPAGFRQWYYDRLRPWQHFVPVRADLSDLFEKYDWVRSNPGEAKAIAAAGQAVAGAMTLGSELDEGARLIVENQRR